MSRYEHQPHHDMLSLRKWLGSGLGLMMMIVPWLSPGDAEGRDRRGSQPAEEQRTLMVEEQIEARGIRDSRILEAMRTVPRHRFVPEELTDQAYGDYPLPIGWEQTISQPYIVALMCDLIGAQGDERILEVGTGSGYHAAVLSRLVQEVYSIEIVEPLGRRAGETLRSLGYNNVHVRLGDGYRGWPEAAPFDAIVLTAAPAEVPQPLLDQLKVGGRMILPLGRHAQDLVVITRTKEGFEQRAVAAVRFVPMTGEAQRGGSP